MFMKKQIYSILNDDHDCLYRGLQNLKKMIEKGDKKESIHNVLKLISFEFSSHFYREEEMMDTYEYSDTKRHRYTHAMLTQVLQTFINNITHDRYVLKAADVDHIDSLLTEHIAIDDVPLEKYMAKIEKAENEEDMFSKISFHHRASLWIKMKFSHIKIASRILMFPRRPLFYKNVPKSSRSARQSQNEENKKYHGWYYGNF